MKRSSNLITILIACCALSLGASGLPSQASNTNSASLSKSLSAMKGKIAKLDAQVLALKKSQAKASASTSRSLQALTNAMTGIETYAYWPARQLVANVLSTVQDSLAIVECKQGNNYAYGTAFAATSNEPFPASDYQNGVKTVLLTAKHVVAGCDTVTVYPYIAHSLDFTATVLHTDSERDIAAIGIPYAIKTKLSPSTTYPTEGSFLMATGFGGDYAVTTMTPRVAVGNVEAVETDYLVMDATIRSGFSGGPVVDWNGDWLGITTGLEVDDAGAMTPLARVPHTVCLSMYKCKSTDTLMNW